MNNMRKVAGWIGSSIQMGLVKTVDTIVYKKRVKKGTKVGRFEKHDSYAMPKFIRSNRVQKFLQKRKQKQNASKGIGQKQSLAVDHESAVPLGVELRFEIGYGPEEPKQVKDDESWSYNSDDNLILINDPRVPSQMRDCWKDKFPGTYRLRRNPGEIGFIVDTRMTGPSNLRVPPIIKAIDVLIPVKNMRVDSSTDGLAEWRAESSSDYFLIECPGPIESKTTLPMITHAKVDMHDLSETLTIQQAVDDVVETVNNILGESLQQVNVFASTMNFQEEPVRSQETQDPKLTLELNPSSQYYC